jgi:hypothetical protein
MQYKVRKNRMEHGFMTGEDSMDGIFSNFFFFLPSAPSSRRSLGMAPSRALRHFIDSRSVEQQVRHEVCIRFDNIAG